MALLPDKQQLFAQHSPQKSARDTGSPESQIALFTRRIGQITHHLKQNKKDKSSQRGLLQLVSKRKKQLKYLKRKDISRYRTICEALKIRK